MAYPLNKPGYDHALKLIKAGDTSTDPWVFDAADGDALLDPDGDDWANYSRFHLATDPEMPADTKGHYHFPHGKAGKVYRRALARTRQRASQFDHTEVFNAAGKLMDAWDEAEAGKGKSGDVVAAVPRLGGLEFKARRFELKAAGDSGRCLTGHGAAFLNVDSQHDIIAPGAFRQDLAAFLDDGFMGGLNHDWNNPIASIATAREDETGLYFETSDVIDTPEGNKVLALTRGDAPVVKRLSIGYEATGFRFMETMDECKAFWESYNYTPTERDLERSKAGVRLLTRIRTFEVSPVVIPANDLASITGVKTTHGVRGRFADHSQQVVSAVQEFLSRAESRDSARTKEGRVLSQANMDEIASVAETMESGSRRLRGLVVKAKPERDRPSDDEPAADAGKSADQATIAETAAEPSAAVTTTPDTTDTMAQYRREQIRFLAGQARRRLAGARR